LALSHDTLWVRRPIPPAQLGHSPQSWHVLFIVSREGVTQKSLGDIVHAQHSGSGFYFNISHRQILGNRTGRKGPTLQQKKLASP